MNSDNIFNDNGIEFDKENQQESMKLSKINIGGNRNLKIWFRKAGSNNWIRPCFWRFDSS